MPMVQIPAVWGVYTEKGQDMTGPHTRLDRRAVDRVSGPAWDGLRDQFLTMSKLLLDLGPDVYSMLTTIYVKFTKAPEQQQPFAVIWVKNSKQMTVGLALPEGHGCASVTVAPQGMSYRGLTGYVTVKPGESLPEEVAALCRLAYEDAP